ncbi:MAG: hypothetical protein IT289_08675 [Oligoflexia bacterium]|nr:hypothetical protein [Oligoflexia bacterium]
MSHFLMGLFPLVVFWVVEEQFGTAWGLGAAMAWALGELVFGYWKFKKVDRLTLVVAAIVVVSGGVSLLTQEGIFFKLSPVLSELVMIPLFFMKGASGEPLLLEMSEKMRSKKAPEVKSQEQLIKMRRIYALMARQMIAVILIHCAVMTWAAFYSTTSVWIFWKGIGFFVLFGIWAVSLYVFSRIKNRRK